MAKKKKIDYNNAAVNLQLRIAADIGELLKTQGVNISSLDVNVRTMKEKKIGKLTKDKNIISLNGFIKIEFNSKVNPKQKFTFGESGDEYDDGDDGETY